MTTTLANLASLSTDHADYHRRMTTAGDPAQTRWEIGQQLRRLFQSAPAVHAELAARIGVGLTDLLALDHLTAAPEGLGVVELSRLLHIRSASATVLVDRLVTSGHLQRHPHPSDGRRTTVSPTATAHRDVRDALEPLIADISRITGELTPTQAAVVLRFLTEITAALTGFADDDDRGGRLSGKWD